MHDNEYEERYMAAEYTSLDNDIETSLRPRVMADYIGQEKVKENLEIYIQAARKRKTSAPQKEKVTASV